MSSTEATFTAGLSWPETASEKVEISGMLASATDDCAFCRPASEPGPEDTAFTVASQAGPLGSAIGDVGVSGSAWATTVVPATMMAADATATPKSLPVRACTCFSSRS
ncbi:hypothetical protein GCM10010409_08630 [Mycolicibacterium diernhoferi]